MRCCGVCVCACVCACVHVCLHVYVCLEHIESTEMPSQDVRKSTQPKRLLEVKTNCRFKSSLSCLLRKF
uniref:Secreted protein n=1 Tax=Anguilla anguilla TaxID=7936 RepID=A0A0E9SAH6_ANGAN